jgi:hypothetical protein
VVSNTEGEMIETEALVLALGKSIHEAQPTSWRWDVDLHVTGEAGAVPGVLVAGK